LNNHPLEFVPVLQRRRVLIIFIGLSILCYLVFIFLDRPLAATTPPTGIVAFELAGTPEKAGEMIASWDESARLNIAFGLGFDFLFMPIYAISLGLATLLAMYRRDRPWMIIGRLIGWGVVFATLFDSFENIALFAQLTGNPVSQLAGLALYCALIKFSLLILGTFYALIGWFSPQASGGLSSPK
jgi:hypothetical protein